MKPRACLLLVLLAACPDREGPDRPIDGGLHDAQSGRVNVTADFRTGSLDGGGPSDSGGTPADTAFPRSWLRRELANAPVSTEVTTVLDTVHQKLAIINSLEGGGLSLLRCELDGTRCLARMLSPDVGAASAEIDVASDKLHVYTGAGILRCELDGSSCVEHAYPGVQPMFGFRYGVDVAVALDRAERKLLFVGPSNLDEFQRPYGLALTRCEADVTGCQTLQLSASGDTQVYSVRGALLDSLGAKLRIFTGAPMTVWQCNRDGTGCSKDRLPADSPAGVPIEDGAGGFYAFSEGRALHARNDATVITSRDLGRAASGAPQPIVDTARNQLLLTSDGPLVSRCGQELKSCTTVDLSLAGTRGGTSAGAVLDAANDRLLVVALDSQGRAELWSLALNAAALPPELPPSLGTGTIDPSLAWVDVSAGRIYDRAEPLVAAIAEANGQLLAAAPALASEATTPLLRCALDGTNCVVADAPSSYMPPRGLAIDAIGNKVLLFDGTSTNVCTPDGSSCSYTGFPAPYGGSFGARRTLVDPTGANVVGVTCGILAPDASGYEGVGLSRCDIAGQGCVRTDISMGATCPSEGSFALDAATVYVASANHDAGPITLTRCNADGTRCSFASVPTDGNEINGALDVVLDPVNQKLLVVRLRDATLQMVRCELDLTDCATVDLSARYAVGRSAFASAAIDVAHQKLLVASTREGHYPWLARCNLDGSGCEAVDLSAGGIRTSGPPTATVDAVRNRLLITTIDRAGHAQLGTIELK